MPLLVRDQRTPEWKSCRIGRITSSTAAGCLGISPWMSRQKAWRIIMGTEPDRENRAMRWGTEFEATARAAYEVETGNLVTETGFWVSDEFDWLGASPDGFVGDDGMLEVKCPGEVHDEIPAHYEVQMMVQMFVANRQWCDFWSWTHTDRYLCRLPFDGDRFDEIFLGLQEFRNAYILTNTQPPRKSRKSQTQESEVTDGEAAVS